MHHMQIHIPVQDPDASHAKPCAVNPYAGAAFQQCQQFLTAVQAPSSCTGSLHCGSLLTAPTLPYAGSRSQCFTCKSLCLYRFPKLHTHILTFLQVPNNSDHSLRLGSLPKMLKISYTTNINSV
ncbi:hypothetical protein O181_042003 [Austropuccinia psidii MF-1]|uniref:Uncharacterized protein n=1 Tax=Austropuccinia psidii MF-1 TaxID=1389203 RepID=A0A9Q3DKA5_9BASI|nr:hypothetical protein [Austropuccinia psidii MF-1]